MTAEVKKARDGGSSANSINPAFRSSISHTFTFLVCRAAHTLIPDRCCTS